MRLNHSRIVVPFLFLSLSWTAPAQANPCNDYVPSIPSGLYKGPYDQLPSVRKVQTRMQRHGRYFPAAGFYSDYYRFDLAGQKYFAYPMTVGFEINSILGDDPRTLQNTHNSYIECYDDGYGPSWGLSLYAWSGPNDQKVCALNILNIPPPASGKGLPPGSIDYIWECSRRTGDEEFRPYEYARTLEHKEAIFPDGKVYWPKEPANSEDPVQWVPADLSKSWLHHPELIPEEARFRDNPMIRLLLTGKTK
ncbi:MAG: hypothetical protein KDK37_15885 [Leptospiraceae bacterium]|nr:hypothetical protein [Leptospiraceae bacterium]